MEQDATPPEKRHEEKFVPRGAIAFMILMAIAYGAIWLFFYLLMAGRP